MTLPSTEVRETLTARLAKMSRAQLKAVLSDHPAGAGVWIGNLAREGLPAAQVLYASMLLEGNGLAQNQVAAVEWFKKAAQQNSADGLNMLGRCLEHGWGCDADAEASAQCFLSAALLGHSWALYNLGHRYLNGLGIRKDWPAAFGCYLQAAEQGHPRAMNLVGRCLEQGWGVAPDQHQAGDWYRQSAELGYFRGQYNWASTLLSQGHINRSLPWFADAYRSCNAAIQAAIVELLDQQASRLFDPLRAVVNAQQRTIGCQANSG